MATNQFKPFATGPAANVTPQEDWEALPALLSGFTSGKASSAQVNKALRQTSFIASALAEFVSEKSGEDVLDDGDVAGFIAKLTSGFAAEYLSRENPFGDIKADGSAAVSTALANLGLGEAAKRGVGNNISQIPDMSFWSKKNTGNYRWCKLPDGTIIQQGLSPSGFLGQPENIKLPIAFSNANYTVVASYDNARTDVSSVLPSFAALPVSGSEFALMGSLKSSEGNIQYAYWIAIGE